MRRIGVLGASFNPPTLGHQDVVDQALNAFDEILLIPSFSHAFQKRLALMTDRLRMLQIFIQHWQNLPSPQIIILNIEEMIALKNPEKKVIYTYDVLCELQAFYEVKNHPFTLSFIMGPDNAAPDIWQKFYRYDEIEKKWPLFIVDEKKAIHSTLVREVIRNFSEDPEKLKKILVTLVDAGIAQYILQHHLYKGGEWEKKGI